MTTKPTTQLKTKNHETSTSMWKKLLMLVRLGCSSFAFGNEKYFENDSNDIEQIIEKRFRELIDKDLPKIIERLNQEIKNGSR